MSATWCNTCFSVDRPHPMRFICGWRLQAAKLLLAAIAFFLPAISSAQSITGFTINDMGPIQGLEQLTVQFMGVKGDLLERSGVTGPDLALVGDALWSSTALARTGEIVSLPVAATRLRLGIEGGWTFSLPRGGSLRPRLEAGARRDSGDVESAFGVALGGGIAWKGPRLGIALDVSGRALVSYEAGGIRHRGLAAELTLFPSAGNDVGLEITARW